MSAKLCPRCGEENPERFRLCGFCGAELTPAVAPDVRKTVSIVFSDLAGSTKLGEALEPEALREVMLRYFEVMRQALEEHGGTVEKYIGDAVMAVFGLPRIHEDDALRAVRAAAAMQAELAALNDELERRWGVRLINRTGVNTGEVVAGDASLGQRLVTGDAVNVAARLEQAAPGLEILIGEPTYRLVRDAVEVEAVEPLELKGKAERVPAYRLIAVPGPDASAQRHDFPLVGRERELTLLEGELDLAKASQTSRLLTVVASAGVGKSRLVEEFARRTAPGAQLLRGRCLSYGRGITFWPVAEILRTAAVIRDDDSPITAIAKLRELAGESADGVVERVAAAVGLSDDEFPLQELFWGIRKLLEALARERPLVVVFEDVHWAEVTLLDLIDHLVDTIDDVPILIICAARPDLLDHRDTSRGTFVEVQPLSDAESMLVIENVLGEAGLPPSAQDRIVGAAGGNPLFVEQMLGMLIDDGLLRRVDGRWVCESDLSELSVPPSIQALLAARLDLLSPDERAIIEPASVIGVMFAEPALESLVEEGVRPRLGPGLAALAGKQLVRRDPTADGDRVFHFEHVLIREAAYHGQLKRSRATLHERFVEWAERINRERDRETEFEEILGYHLEQAHQLLGELAPIDDHARSLGERGARYLATAGRRAFARPDMAAAANLLRRAVTLLPSEDRRRTELLPELGEALMETGEFAWAELYLEEAVAGAAALDDHRLEADAVLTRLLVRHHVATNLDVWREEVERETDRLIPALQGQAADAELAKAWRMVAFVHGSVCRWEEVAAAQERAIEHAREAGRPRQEARAASGYTIALRDGPTPVADAIARCEEIIASGLVDRQAEALVLCSLAYLEAMRGGFGRARELYSNARALFVEVGAAVLAAHTSLTSGRVELLAGDAAAAERELRSDYEALGAMGERYFRPLVAALLAQAVYLQGRYDEARELTEEARQMADSDDIETQAVWRTILSRLRLDEGNDEEAESLAREAVELLRATDAPVMRGDALLHLGIVLNNRGQNEEARAVLEEARRLYADKGIRPAAARVDDQMGELASELTA